MPPRRKHGKKNKNKGKAIPVSNEEDEKAPKSIVINRTPLGPNGHKLMQDVRVIMEPYTTTKLRARKNNVLKDYVNVASSLGVSHLMLFSRTEAGLNLRMGRIPRGPTLTFRVCKYTLIKDMFSGQKTGRGPPVHMDKPPLLVLNNFNKPLQHVRLMAKLLQSMFPSIKVEKVALSALRRVALFYFNEETDEVELRHYEITVKPVGLTRGVKMIMRSKNIDLSEYEDISSFVLENADGYESDAETAMGTNKVVLPQTVAGAGNKASQQSAVKLVEIGPRMNLRLLKIEEGLCEGRVLHHSYLHKTDAEVKALDARRQRRLTEKARRRQEQERNIERKRKERDENKLRSIAGQRAKAVREGKIAPDAESDGSASEGPGDGAELWSDDDDNQYYRDEVGEDVPDGMNLNRGGSGAVQLPKWKQKRMQRQEEKAAAAAAKNSSSSSSKNSDGDQPAKKAKRTGPKGKARGNQARKAQALMRARESSQAGKGGGAKGRKGSGHGRKQAGGNTKRR